jgi:hypothetical protein
VRKNLFWRDADDLQNLFLNFPLVYSQASSPNLKIRKQNSRGKINKKYKNNIAYR